MHLKLTPKWKHDCDKCILLGHTTHNKGTVDLYCHPYSPIQDGITLVARYGNEGNEYISHTGGISKETGNPCLWLAKKLWKEKLNEASSSSDR
jgi:hypothetical protein